MFNYNIIRRKISAFGNLFNLIYVRRDLERNVKDWLKLPVAYSNKEKMIQMYTLRGDDPTNFLDNIKMSMPRAAFEITNLVYNAEQKINRLHRFVNYSNNTIQNHSNNTIESLTGDSIDIHSTNIVNNVYSYVPYKIFFNLYLLTNRNEDTFQLVEQILARFSTFIVQKIKYDLGNDIILEFDESVNLISVEKEVVNQETFKEYTEYIHTFKFSSDIKFFGDYNEDNRIIKKTEFNFGIKDNTEFVITKNLYAAPKDEDIIVDLNKFYFYFYDDLYGDQKSLENSQFFENI